MTNLDSIFKSRDITLPTKVSLVKAMVFPVVMYGCESWTVKKADRLRIDAFELWCWRTLLRVPWTARRYNQSILKEISPGIYFILFFILFILFYFFQLNTMIKQNYIWKKGSIRLGRSSGERNDYPLQYSWLETSMDRGGWRATVHWVTKNWTQLSDFC